MKEILNAAKTEAMGESVDQFKNQNFIYKIGKYTVKKMILRILLKIMSHYLTFWQKKTIIKISLPDNKSE